MGKFPILETERLQLREITLLDAESMFHYFSKDSVLRYFGMEPFHHVEEVENIIRHFRTKYEEGATFRWGIVLKGTNTFIGSCGFHLINSRHKKAEIGYELDDTYWGKGYAAEALQAILTYGFKTLDFERIAAIVYTENEASHKLLKKSGFQEEGLLRKNMIQSGVAYDTVLHALLKEEWRERA